MSAVTALPWGRELTVDDLDQLPDDGHRYELIDGALIVTPAPTPQPRPVGAPSPSVRHPAPARSGGGRRHDALHGEVKELTARRLPCFASTTSAAKLCSFRASQDLEETV